MQAYIIILCLAMDHPELVDGLVKELEKMLPYWKNIRAPVYYVQGANDDIVDTANAGFAREQLINVPSLEIKFLNGRKHLLARYEWAAIKQGILDVYERLQKEIVSSQWSVSQKETIFYFQIGTFSHFPQSA